MIAADGTLQPYKTPEINGRPQGRKGEIVETPKTRELETAQAAIAEAVAKVHLELVCKQCTREASFPGVTRSEALASARKAGWQYRDDGQGGSETCPHCLATKAA